MEWSLTFKIFVKKIQPLTAHSRLLSEIVPLLQNLVEHYLHRRLEDSVFSPHCFFYPIIHFRSASTIDIYIHFQILAYAEIIAAELENLILFYLNTRLREHPLPGKLNLVSMFNVGKCTRRKLTRRISFTNILLFI